MRSPGVGAERDLEGLSRSDLARLQGLDPSPRGAAHGPRRGCSWSRCRRQVMVDVIIREVHNLPEDHLLRPQFRHVLRR